MSIGVPIRKAAAGFTRGLGHEKAGHKYWKRVRVIVNGKPGWRYYYNNEKDRAAYAAWRERKLSHKQRIKGAQERLAALERDHKLKGDWHDDHPDLLIARKELRDLTHEYMQEVITWDKAPNLKVTGRVGEEYHHELLDIEEPDDPHGAPLSAYRAVEMAYQRMPSIIKNNFSGCIKDLMIKMTEEDDYWTQPGKGGVAGYYQPGTKNISINYELCAKIASGRQFHGMGSGLLPVEVIVHEMGHAIHYQMGTNSRAKLPDGYNGPKWADWLDFYKSGGAAEKGVTAYAETNEKERFCESFTAALMYPRQLADAAPGAYEWFRNFLGPEAMRPLRTDVREVANLEARLAKLQKDGADEVEIRKAKHLLDMAHGVHDMAKDDRRLQWWLAKETPLQTLIREEEKPDYTTVYEHDTDKFYEMSVGGRTIYFRHGKPGASTAGDGWTPEKGVRGGKSKRVLMRASNLKEIYDADGKPLTAKSAFLYLYQDSIDMESDEVKKWVETGELPYGGKATGGTGWMLSKHLQYLTEKVEAEAEAETDEDKAKVWKPKKGGVNYTKTMVPVEIDQKTFMLRSGSFGYRYWGMAGQDEYDQLRTIKTPRTRQRLMAAFLKKQPGVVRGEDGQPIMDVIKDGEQPVPRLETIRYVNDNPDGSKTMIECQRSTETGSRAGLMVIKDPVWRELLTPDGEPIKSAEHLTFLCRQAAEGRNRTWASVKADTPGGDLPHYLHMEIEFDGRGQPRLIGDEWRRRTGKTEPRIDDLLQSPKRGVEVEKDRATIPAERIKLRPPPKRKKLRGALPRVGEQMIINVPKIAVGVKADLLPKPAWDDLPEGAEPFPPDPGGTPADRLRASERRLIAEGYLSAETYNGTPAQRAWVEGTLKPLIDAYESTKDKAILAQLTSIIPGKKAGEVPAPPGWNTMPLVEEGDEPYAPYPDDPDGTGAKKLTVREKKLKGTGQLPENYRGTKEQRSWLRLDFARAMKQYNATKDELTAEALPPRYVFTSVRGAGFPGGRTIVKYGEAEVIKSVVPNIEPQVPKALKHDTLIYVHREVNSVTGDIVDEELRMLLPSDGSVPWQRMAPLHGVTVMEGKIQEGTSRQPVLRINMDGFARLRSNIGGCSLTADAEAWVRASADTLKEAAQKQEQGENIIELSDLDVQRLSDGEVPGFGQVGLNPMLFGGSVPFVLPRHQQEMIQTIVNNDGRGAAFHFMGTGKTVEAIAVSKILHAKVDPEDPTKPHPNAPKKTLMVVPLNTVEQWRQAAHDFDEGATVVGAGKTHMPIKEFIKAVKEGRDTNDIVICGPRYFTLHQEALREAGIDGLCIDEAHLGLKSKDSDFNKAIREWNPHMKSLIMLTGTPITVSPTDVLEYVKLMSQGEQWGGYTKKRFEDEYLEPSPIPQMLGLIGKKGPKLQVKPSKRNELAAIIARWSHVAMPKDVRGKVLPAVRIEEHKHAEMVGTQSTMYNLYMASLSEGDKAQLATASAMLSDDETAKMSKEVKARVAAARAIANCAVYKPANDDPVIKFNKEIPVKGGKTKTDRQVFRTFDVDHLLKRTDVPPKVRKKVKGRWPPIEELGQERVAIYNAIQELQDVLHQPYEELAGTKISKEHIERMRAAGWVDGGITIRNPDAGPLGIICRGSDTPRQDPEYLRRVDAAMEFQRRYGQLIVEGVERPDPNGVMKNEKIPPAEALTMTASEFGIDIETAKLYLGTRPNDHDHHDELHGGDYGMPGVVVSEGEKYFSWQKDSLHLLVREEDWDHDKDAPKEGAKTVMDVGMRAERQKTDLMMVAGNAKAEELRAHIQRFHTTSGHDGPDGRRQMVMFAKDILQGCRVMEASLRSMGYRDVNEVIEGSPHFDPDDDMPGNGKYFVTYIGKTYTGERDLNAEIFKKQKDKLGRDSETSLFVHKTLTGRKWSPYPGASQEDVTAHGVQLSQWSPDDKKKIKTQFGIDVPESLWIDEDGVQRYFTGDKKSARMLRQIVLVGDPTKMERAEDAEAARDKIAKLQAKYVEYIRGSDLSTTTPPLTQKQITVFNNCEFVVCSDAANVGLNFGNAVESVNFDTLGSPALEWQRITRSARMLPPAITEKLWGKRIMVQQEKLKRDIDGNIEKDEDGNPIMEPVFRDGKPVMVQAVDAKGNLMYGDDGVASKLKRIEASALAPMKRGQTGGTVTDLSLYGLDSYPGAMDMATAVLNVMDQADSFLGTKLTKKNRQKWMSIKAKARNAVNLGVNAMAAVLDEFKETQVPGGTENIVSFTDIHYPDPTAGTYDMFEGSEEMGGSRTKDRRENMNLVVNDAVTKMRGAIMHHPDITDEDRQALIDAGYAMKGDDGEPISTVDPAAVYLSLRASEILKYIEDQRPIVTQKLRSAPGGEIIQESDVMNEIIDSLTPNDRAILKAKKYLVNVRRIGVSAVVPQTVPVEGERMVVGDDGTLKMEKVQIPTFVGYAKEHPIKSEQTVRAMQRARQTAYEKLIFDIQNGTPYRTDLDYETTDAESIANASRMDVRKSQVSHRIGVAA